MKNEKNIFINLLYDIASNLQFFVFRKEQHL